MADVLLSFAGWSFIPSLASGFAQNVYYGITVRAGNAKPTPGSPTWVKHRRRIYTTIILAYLLFTIHEAYQGIQREGDFYRALGIPHDVDDRGIKSRFRRLAALHHPDKVGHADGDSPDPPSDVFVHLKLAQDTLLNPVTRFAYDRFGPSMLKWQHLSTISDYLAAGFMSNGPGYVASGIIMAMLGMIGYLKWGRFWRYLTLAALMLLELYTATRPYFPPILVTFINPALSRFLHVPPLLPFQFLILARKINIAVCIAIAQLGPYFGAGTAAHHKDGVPDETLTHLEQIARSNEVEATRLLDLNMAPYALEPKNVRDLRERMTQWLVQNTIKADPAVRDAVGAALQRRREVDVR